MISRHPTTSLLPLALGLVAVLALSACEHTTWNPPEYMRGYKPIQPISYSHKLHAGEMQIDCRYCHFGADSSRKAGVPPVSVCMNCHKSVKTDSPQIKELTKAYESGQSVQWVKIHNNPDFVAFDHSRHVGKGVACQTCHGPIEEMTEVYQYNNLSMGWCVNCHRDYNARAAKLEAGGDKSAAAAGTEGLMDDGPLPDDLKDKHIHAQIDCTGCHH